MYRSISLEQNCSLRAVRVSSSHAFLSASTIAATAASKFHMRSLTRRMYLTKGKAPMLAPLRMPEGGPKRRSYGGKFVFASVVDDVDNPSIFVIFQVRCLSLRLRLSPLHAILLQYHAAGGMICRTTRHIPNFSSHFAKATKSDASRLVRQSDGAARYQRPHIVTEDFHVANVFKTLRVSFGLIFRVES